VSAIDPLWVLYDAECPVCTGSVGWALRRDRDRQLRPIASDSAQALGLLEARHHQRTRAEIHVVSGREGVLTGADAIAAMLRRLPRWRWAGSLLGARWVLPIARPVYRAFAARRRRIAAACGWKPRPIEPAPR
jgi:predicted DCC family thiol-disulfide oxidoreductase YuxK